MVLTERRRTQSRGMVMLSPYWYSSFVFWSLNSLHFLNLSHHLSALSLLRWGKQECVHIRSAVEMGHKSGHPLCLSRARDVSVWAGSGLILRVQGEHISRWVPGSHHIPAPLSQGAQLKRRAGGAGFVSCKVPTCHTMWSQPQDVLVLGRLLLFLHDKPLQNQLLGGFCFSFISSASVHASPH